MGSATSSTHDNTLMSKKLDINSPDMNKETSKGGSSQGNNKIYKTDNNAGASEKHKSELIVQVSNSTVPTQEDELRTLKERIRELQDTIENQQDEICLLRKKLQHTRKEKDNQVEVVKETVEKVIDEKETEIRRLRAIWGIDSKLIDSEPRTRLLAGNERNQTRARFGISAESRNSNELNVKTFPKTDTERKNIARALRRNIFLTSLAQPQVSELIECMKKEKYPANCNIIKEGDIGSHLYVIEDGEVEVFQTTPSEQSRLALLRPGCVFGELAILYNCKRTASVRSKTPVILWTLERTIFQAVVQRKGKMIRDEYCKLLQTVNQLRHLPEETIRRIADCLEEEQFNAGDFIIRQGEPGDTFYIIYEGKVQVTKFDDSPRGRSEATFLCYMDRGKYFGERALLREEKRAANVIAESEVTCLTLDRLAFISLIGSISEINLSASDQDLPDEKLPGHMTKTNVPSTILEENQSACKSCSQVEDSTIATTSLKDLKIIKVLGKGGFGVVSLVKIPALSGRVFALKKMKKSYIVKMRQEQHVLAEKNILSAMRSPFIACLHKTFRDRSCVYMLMDAYMGGDMYYTLKRYGALKNEAARFSVSCVLEALAYLHARNIAYRDLKPENLLMDSKGYIKLVDFGFAKKVNRGCKTWTFCGTPEYFPPEILQNLGHDFSVDYWSLGVLTFELLTTTTPFYAPDDLSVYEKIVEGIERVRFPLIISKSGEFLIRNLCRLDPKQRLGNKNGGVNDIRKHRWFRGFYWEGLRTGMIPSPFNIKLKGPEDVSNFENVSIDSGLDPEEDRVVAEADMSWELNF